MRTKDGKLLSVTNGDLRNGHFTVPEGIKVITKNAFREATDLKTLRLSKELEEIEEYAFISNLDLVEIDFPSGDIDFRTSRIDCPNLKRISIAGDINDISGDLTAFFVTHDIKDVEFYFYNKSINYHVESSLSTLFKVKDNRFVIVEEKEDTGAVIDEKYVEKFDYPKLAKMFNYDSLDYFLEDYAYVLDYRIDLMYDWGKVISSFKDKNRDYYPSQEAILAIPANKKDIYKYFLNEKKFNTWKKSHFSSEDMETNRNFVKMCYLFGAFNEGEDQKKAYKALDKVLKNNRFSSLNYYFGAIEIDKKDYDIDFTNYLIDNFESIKEVLGQTDYRALNSVYQEFSNIKKDARRNKKELTFDYVNEYMADKRFMVREGNEELFNAVKSYHAEYSRKDFELMQDLFEKAREISLSTTKKIVTTVDQEKKAGSCYYKWLVPTDPANFVLGNKVGCCAKINSVGHGILRESVTNPNVRNLALFGKKNKIIGKATAYFNTSKKYILFNNAEVAECTSDAEKEELLEALVRAVNDQVEIQNKDKLNVEKVAIGMLRNDLEDQIIKKKLKIVRMELLKNNPNYSNDQYFYHGDANNHFKGQCILWKADKTLRRKFL